MGTSRATNASERLDASKMRRAGKPSARTGAPTMAKLADAEVRQKNILRSLVRARAPTRTRCTTPASLSDPTPLSRLTRPSLLPAKAHASYDPKTRVVKQLQSTVDNLLREQASHARLESTSRETFAHLAAEIERVRSAVATLADAVIEEMDAVRADHAAWRSEKEAWTSRMERVEATVEAKSAMIDAWGEARSAGSAAATALRDEMRAATEAAAEARAALAAAEQREADIAERLRRFARRRRARTRNYRNRSTPCGRRRRGRRLDPGTDRTPRFPSATYSSPARHPRRTWWRSGTGRNT